jgi:hypothetical protein
MLIRNPDRPPAPWRTPGRPGRLRPALEQTRQPWAGRPYPVLYPVLYP